MYNRTETIVEAYPYEFTDIVKGRGVYFCHTRDGSKKNTQAVFRHRGKGGAAGAFFVLFKGAWMHGGTACPHQGRGSAVYRYG